MRSRELHHGFTLVELAIVLVIIGLIVGGVLVGQDLIQQAAIRKVISNVERYNVATVTFREKYGGLPGDLINTRATQFGFNTADNDQARDGSAHHGDGNGLIKGCGAASIDNTLGCEASLYWSDLTQAKLITFNTPFTSTNAVPTPDGILAEYTNAEMADGILPKAGVRDNLFIMLMNQLSFDDKNYFWIADVSYIGSVFPNGNSGKSGLTPFEAGMIDNKTDDGEPITGSVFAFTYWQDTYASGTDCIDADNHYNTRLETDAGTPGCSLAIRPAF